MPGTNAGTGQPIAFVCPVERVERNRDRFYGGHGFGKRHEVHRTGRERPYRRRGQGLGRILTTSYEYACSCGHVGWTAHVDITRRYHDPKPSSL